MLRWTDPLTKQRLYEITEFKVLTKAREYALQKSSEVFCARVESANVSKRLTMKQLLDRFEQNYLPLSKGRQRGIDESNLKMWRAYFPPTKIVEEIEKHELELFIQQRMNGEILVPKMTLGKTGPRAPGINLEWLRRCVNLAIADQQAVAKNPVLMLGKKMPKNTTPKQPVATWDRFETIRPFCEDTGGQGLFGGFMDIMVALGWRLSGVRQIQLAHIDRRPAPNAPHGRILRDPEFDKKKKGIWLPISAWLAPRLDDLLERRTKVDAKASPWLFPQVEDPTEPWPRQYAQARLAVAERAAGLAPLDGGQFHPWRRMWATQRKHLPLKDVAFAGCWDERTLLQFYQKTDDETVLDVMNAGLPDVKAKPSMKGKKGTAGRPKKSA